MIRTQVVLRLAAVAALVAAAFAMQNMVANGGGVTPSPTLAQETTEAATVRIAAQRVEDGRTAFALQVHGEDGWGERIEPTANLFQRVEDARVGRWINSTPISLENGGNVRISARLQDDGRIEFALQTIVGWKPAVRILPRRNKFPSAPRVNLWLYSSSVTLSSRQSEHTYVPLVGVSGHTTGGAEYWAGWRGDGVVSSYVQATTVAPVDDSIRTFRISCNPLGFPSGTLSVDLRGLPERHTVGDNPYLFYWIPASFNDGRTLETVWFEHTYLGLTLVNDLDLLVTLREQPATTLTFGPEDPDDEELAPFTFNVEGLLQTLIQENLEQCGMYKPGEERELNLEGTES